MVDNTTMATKSTLQAAFASAGGGLPLLVSPASVHSHPSGGGMKLEAVMENLQRQQAARLALEEKLRQADKEKDARLQQQTMAFRQYPPPPQSSFSSALPEPYAGSGSAPRAQHATRRRPSHGSDEEPERERDAEDDERDIEEDELEDSRVAEQNPRSGPGQISESEITGLSICGPRKLVEFLTHVLLIFGDKCAIDIHPQTVHGVVQICLLFGMIVSIL
ncbi:AT-rich interactive domain-containing protein 3A-like [Arapaima gigas]